MKRTALSLLQPKRTSKYGVESRVRNIPMCFKRPPSRLLTLPVPNLNQRLNPPIHFGRTDLPHELRRHQVINQRSVLLESRVRREELDMLLGQDTADQGAKVPATVEVLGAPE